MNAPAIRAATYNDLLQVPANLVAEIIHGQLITHPRLGWRSTPDAGPDCFVTDPG